MRTKDRDHIDNEYGLGEKFFTIVSPSEGVKYLMVDAISKNRLDFYTLDLNMYELKNLLNLNKDEIKNVSNHELDVVFDYYLEALRENQLIVSKKDSMDTPGPCFSPWIYVYENPVWTRSVDKCVEDLLTSDVYENTSINHPEEICKVRINSRVMYYLDLDNSEEGLEFYQVSKEEYEKEKKNVEECIEGLRQVFD